MQQKVALVSGGSRGLGAAVVRGLLEGDWKVAAFSRSASPLIDELRVQDPDQMRFYWEAIDSADHDSVREFVLRVARRYGRIDALVNNAATFSQAPLALETTTHIHRLISLNIESTVMLTKACARIMLSQGQGCIVNVSSLNAVSGHAGVSVYSATKAALDGLTRSLARELGPRGIRVNSVAPGYFASEMSAVLTDELRAKIVRRTPLRRLGSAEDIACAVCFFLSDQARFVTGQTLVVDGGVTC